MLDSLHPDEADSNGEKEPRRERRALYIQSGEITQPSKLSGLSNLPQKNDDHAMEAECETYRI